MMIAKILVNVCFCIVVVEFIEKSGAKIDPKLRSALKQGNFVNVFVTFNQGINPALERTAAIRKNRAGNWNQRNQAVIDALKSVSGGSQKNVVNILSARSRGKQSFKYFKQYWTSNIVFIKDANIDIIQEIAQDTNVKQIKKEPEAKIPEHYVEMINKPSLYENEEFKSWGLTKIQVKEAWAELGGNRGEGVVVGTIDTGVRHTHEALRDNFVGSTYGWFDPFGNAQEPFSNGLHGTHVTGTLAGSKGIGVAPGVKWMSCISCNTTHCPGEALLDCMQFMSCPTMQDGSNSDCSKTPRIISNSWVTDHGVTDFNDQVLAWRAQGIIPLFAIGNSGFRCRRTEAPGELPWVIGVGSSDPDDWHYYRSSVGPAASGIIKPDIIAPGYGILSASDSSDISYEHLSGTSMATPQVAGVVALLLVRSPNATYEEIFDIITSTANSNITLNKGYLEQYCPEGSPHLIPNIYFGYGRINALKALQAQTKLLKN